MTFTPDEYAQPIMEELNKIFKHFTKVSETSWLIERERGRICYSYMVHTTPNGYIVMTGDFNGVMLRPFGNEDCLPNWAAGAT
ncbi:MAG: hypothetical protein MI867_11380, partial [Pseudomonadales bacterium]|nr:hypothetical protein [Pseudomonadales bacterium]